MDKLDQKILALLSKNARMPVKDIAEKVSLTSPAVSSRIRKLEQDGAISGYTVLLRRPDNQSVVDALISLAIQPQQRDALIELLRSQSEVLQCFHVTGSHSFIIKVSCPDMTALERLILLFQTMGQTSTQIILSTPLDRNGLETFVF